MGFSAACSVALSRLLGTAMAGRSAERQELADRAIPLEATVTPLPCRRGGPRLLERLFAPLGYAVEVERGGPLDAAHPAWGESPFVALTLRRICRLAELPTHLYVLVPVLDDAKHYALGPDEVDKLVARGAGWLEGHPERELIARRYLRRRPLVREALARLAAADEEAADPDEAAAAAGAEEAAIERPLRLHDLRLERVSEELLAAGARRVVDLGCGEGRLLARLLRHGRFEEVVGLDVSVRALEIAARRLRLDEMSPRQRERVRLLHGALTYRDARIGGFDAAALVEVVEHLDPPRLSAMERVVFGHARPGTVVVTTPNREYNGLFEGLPADALRHRDHRFEWTREEFRAWAGGVAGRFGYRFAWRELGEPHPDLGPPSQMGLFAR